MTDAFEKLVAECKIGTLSTVKEYVLSMKDYMEWLYEVERDLNVKSDFHELKEAMENVHVRACIAIEDISRNIMYPKETVMKVKE